MSIGSNQYAVMFVLMVLGCGGKADPIPETREAAPVPQGPAAGPITTACDDLIKVKFLSGNIDYVLWTDLGGDKKVSETELATVTLEITNLNVDRKIQYVTWAREAISTAPVATITDDLGNSYQLKGFGITYKPKGRTARASIEPGASISDVLVFEVPAEKAKSLRISLPKGVPSPGGKINGTEMEKSLELVIPTELLTKSVRVEKASGR